MTHPDDLSRKYNRKSILQRSEWNTVVESLKAPRSGQYTFSDGSSAATRLAPLGIPDIIATSAIDVPQSSIFGAILQGAGGNTFSPLKIAVAQIGEDTNKGTAGLFFTNEGSKIPAGGSAIVRPVFDWSVARIAITGAIPEVGAECGPEDNAWGLDKGGSGLLCLALEAGIYAWVMRLSILTYIGKPTLDIAALAADTPGFGTVTLWRFNNLDDIEATNVTVKAANLSGAFVPANKLVQMKMVQRRICIEHFTASRRYKGVLTADLVSTNANANVTITGALDGGAGVGIIIAANPDSLSGLNGYNVLVEEDLDAGGYILYQVQHNRRQMVRELDYVEATHTLRQRTMDINVLHDGNQSDWIDVVEAELWEVIDSVNWDGFVLAYHTRLVYTFPDSDDGGDVPILTAVTIPVVHDVYVSGLNLMQSRSYFVQVLAVAFTAEQVIVLGDQCVEPSTSIIIITEPTVDHTAEFLQPDSEFFS